jgi:hypothetical protein
MNSRHKNFIKLKEFLWSFLRRQALLDSWNALCLKLKDY